MILTKEMITADAHESKDLWETPDHIFHPLNDKYRFTLDPCCTLENAKCKKIFTEYEDALIHSWAGNCVFVNPPYSRWNIDKWVKKCLDESNGAKVVALLPVSTSADWFQNYVLGNTIFWVNKRIKFVNAPYTAPFSSMIVDFNGVDRNYSWKQ